MSLSYDEQINRKWKLTIPGPLPGLNEYIEAERGNKYKAATMKKQTERTVMVIAKSQLRGVKIEKPVRMIYTWYEPNRKRDKDNIAFAKKFIQDALIKSGIITNDGWNEIESFTDKFRIDKKDPRVEIEIEEVS